MKYLDLTLDDAAQNLACDEALLEAFEESGQGEDLLRVWHPAEYFVVLGHGNRLRDEVDAPICAAAEMPVLRRCSGGGTVLQGPGCFNYSLILQQNHFAGADVRAAFDFVLERHRSCLESLLGSRVGIKGISDLTLGDRKFSGNAQYRKRRYLLVHGTFLLDFDLPLVARFLRVPMQQPNYRRQRNHGDFLVNLNIDASVLRDALRSSWNAEEEFAGIPLIAIHRLLRERYRLSAWNQKF